MARIGAQRAAELTGLSRWTITRRIAAGQLSCTRDNRGRPLIDVSELARAFDLDAGVLARTVAEQRDSRGSVHRKPRNPGVAPASIEADLQVARNEAANLSANVARLEAELSATRGELREVRAEVLAWSAAFRQLSDRLAVLALEDRRAAAPTPPAAPASRPPTGATPHPEAAERSVRGVVADGVAALAAWIRR